MVGGVAGLLVVGWYGVAVVEARLSVVWSTWLDVVVGGGWLVVAWCWVMLALSCWLCVVGWFVVGSHFILLSDAGGGRWLFVGVDGWRVLCVGVVGCWLVLP